VIDYHNLFDAQGKIPLPTVLPTLTTDWRVLQAIAEVGWPTERGISKGMMPRRNFEANSAPYLGQADVLQGAAVTVQGFWTAQQLELPV
jgi:hypothetical protein